MRKILFAADFPIEKSGIVSTASSILAEDLFGATTLYSRQQISINGNQTHSTTELHDDPVDLVFCHTEYSGLPALIHRYPEALFHVGDWPLLHWKSVSRLQPAKGFLAQLRCRFRLRRIPLSARLCFVTQKDCDGATEYGFYRATHVPIGVKSASVPPAPQVDSQTLCFSGNFRYEPNREAAQRLLDLVRSKCPEFKVVLVGFHADDFQGPNVEIHANVPSVVDFLASRRPIYVSLIKTGAGAKNKILEAMVTGCPILCTPQSLDASIPEAPSIKVVTNERHILAQLRKLCNPSVNQIMTQESSILAEETKKTRDWHFVAESVARML